MADKLEEMLVAFKEMLFHSDAMSIKPTTTRQVETTQITTRESQLLQVVLSKAADEITRLHAENERIREETLREAAKAARGWVMWVLKGYERRENVADRVSERILALITKASRDSGHE